MMRVSGEFVAGSYDVYPNKSINYYIPKKSWIDSSVPKIIQNVRPSILGIL